MIEANLNFDMLASPNFARLVYDGDGSEFGLVGPDGSDEIEAALVKFFRTRGLATQPTAFEAATSSSTTPPEDCITSGGGMPASSRRPARRWR